MQKGIIAKKIGMTQIFDENGKVIPVTVVEAAPNVVVQVKTVENDGYAAVQLGYGDKKATRVNKPMKGHFDKANAGYKRTLKEFRLDNCDLEAGSLVKADVFAVGDIVDVSGTSKGKGFAGVMKRHGFGGGPGGHGSHFHRAPGSIGQCATPSRVLKGVRLPGHMGCDRVTVKNLEVVRIDEDLNLILVKGAVPGGKNGIVRVRMAGDGKSW
jgi:large subunit ribosomal protein L3